MSTAVAQAKKGPSRAAVEPKVNDVVIEVATENGSGSQSANLILMRSIFNMGVPVSGKNLFPSNIQGLPTWFTVRANADGWTCRRADTDIMVAMNPETVAEDVAGLKPGAILVTKDGLKSFVKRDDLETYFVPFDSMVRDVVDAGKLRKMVVNIIYDGVLAYLLDIDPEAMEAAIVRQFGNKPKAAELNRKAANVGFDWAKDNLRKQAKYRLERMTATDRKILIEGNEASALGMVFGGATVCTWYPITPSSSLCESFIAHAKKLRHDPDTGKATYGVIQAEDELASIAMVVGAGWAGARAFTATAGPGISLMSEIAGLSYFAEIPAVIVDVQRMGPSTGLPTRTCQGDMSKAYNLSHGDCRHPLLIPGNIQECFEFASESLNLAEKLQTLVFMMIDLDMGMNTWMSEPLDYPQRPIERGKVLDAEALGKNGAFARYKDVDGDGIPYRTLPGTNHPNAAYFTRGTGHTDEAKYSEKPADWKNNMDRLLRKFDTARKMLPKPVIETMDGADIGIIAFGSSDPAVQEARSLLETDRGVKTDYLRLRALPIGDDVRKYIASHRIIYVIEQNRDAQVASIFKLECPDRSTCIRNILHYDGLPIHAATIVDQLLDAESKENA
jgi:2-oxoglutarate ferredoxin oxidoreductase subunit alpha